MEAKQTKCPNCGANLDYKGRYDKIKCEYCGNSFIGRKEDSSKKMVELTPDALKFVNEIDTVSSTTKKLIFITIFFMVTGFISMIIGLISYIFIN